MDFATTKFTNSTNCVHGSTDYPFEFKRRSAEDCNHSGSNACPEPVEGTAYESSLYSISATALYPIGLIRAIRIIRGYKFVVANQPLFCRILFRSQNVNRGPTLKVLLVPGYDVRIVVIIPREEAIDDEYVSIQ